MKFSIPNNTTFATSCSSNFNQTSLIEPENPNDADLLLTGVADPIEPFNRSMYAVNKLFLKTFSTQQQKDITTLCRKPRELELKTFTKNLLYPVRVVNNALQNQWEEAWVETKRFGINTTIGFLGFTDPATDKYGMELYNEDLGLTFGHYGWEPQMYIYLPFFGGSSERDLLGRVGDYFLDPATHVGDHILSLESYYFPAGPAMAQQHLLYRTKYKRNFDYSVRCLRASAFTLLSSKKSAKICCNNNFGASIKLCADDICFFC